MCCRDSDKAFFGNCFVAKLGYFLHLWNVESAFLKVSYAKDLAMLRQGGGTARGTYRSFVAVEAHLEEVDSSYPNASNADRLVKQVKRHTGRLHDARHPRKQESHAPVLSS